MWCMIKYIFKNQTSHFAPFSLSDYTDSTLCFKVNLNVLSRLESNHKCFEWVCPAHITRIQSIFSNCLAETKTAWEIRQGLRMQGGEKRSLQSAWRQSPPSGKVGLIIFMNRVNPWLIASCLDFSNEPVSCLPEGHSKIGSVLTPCAPGRIKQHCHYVTCFGFISPANTL